MYGELIMKKEQNITRTSLCELRKLRSEGKLNTELALLKAKTEEELEKDISSDPDSNVDIEWLKSGVVACRKKKKD